MGFGCPRLLPPLIAFRSQVSPGLGASPQDVSARRKVQGSRSSPGSDWAVCLVSSTASLACTQWISRRQGRRGAVRAALGVRVCASHGGEAAPREAQGAIIDGKAIAAQVRGEVQREASELKALHGVTPGLAVLLVGDRPDSASYVRGKAKAAREVGCKVFHHPFPEGVSEEALLRRVEELNADAEVHGILVQLPLPAGLDELRILRAIDVQKDVDGLSPENMGMLAQGDARALAPCTAAGCMELLHRSGVELEGRDCLVLGRSRIVGLPMALLLLQANATVTICHSRSRDIAEDCAQADILVAAVGQPEFVQGHWIREGAVVLDVGINRVPAATKRGYRLVGDVAFASARSRVSKITPVPGGVGPMTVAMLLKNTLMLAQRAAQSTVTG